MKRLALLLLLLLALPAPASNMVYGPAVDAKVTSAQIQKSGWKLKAKLLKAPMLPPGEHYDASAYKAGTEVPLEVADRTRKFRNGQVLRVRWCSYSAMGPNGPVGGLSWEVME